MFGIHREKKEARTKAYRAIVYTPCTHPHVGNFERLSGFGAEAADLNRFEWELCRPL